MNYTIRSDEARDYRVCETDDVASALQNAALLLSTRRGTVPMYRDFGLPMAFEHLPEDAALSVMAAEIADALEEFEPRLRYVDARAERTGAAGNFVMIAEVEYAGD